MATQPTPLRPDEPRRQRLHLAYGPDGVVMPLPVDDLPPEELRARVEALAIDKFPAGAEHERRDRRAA